MKKKEICFTHLIRLFISGMNNDCSDHTKNMRIESPVIDNCAKDGGEEFFYRDALRSLIEFL